MGYPPEHYRVDDPEATLALMRAHPFAHVITGHAGLRVTRVPVVADRDRERLRLRAHLDARNPQAVGLDGAPVLVAFSGPAAYVSPHWRADRSKGGTYDYEEVQVHGTARVLPGADAFAQLVDDLSRLIEPQHPEIGNYPIWSTAMAPPGHVARQAAFVVTFAVEVERTAMVAKLHQDFPAADRASVAEHLRRSRSDEVRAIGAKIRAGLDPA